MVIYKNGTRQIRPKFNEEELFSTSPDAPESHYISDNLLDGMQIFRDWLGVTVTVNSTYRTPKHNKSEGGGVKSQHLKGTAGDLDAVQEAVDRAKKNIRERGDLFKKLRAAGISGFGLYGGFIHLDARTDGGNQKDHYGSYAYWDLDSSQKKKINS
jgi:uncharacterized protein YcbK (DUF882 family)